MTAHLPQLDPSNPVETAVIRGLVRGWPRRATVRRREPELDAPTMDELYDEGLADFPEAMLPFAGHPLWERLDDERRTRVRAWAWIAYNKNVIDIEQDVVTPAFGLLFRDAFGTGLSDADRAAVVQSMVDEEYHTLMHLNASTLTRWRRGWELPDATLPKSLTARRHREALARAASPRSAALTSLAYATVAETSITDYLTLVAEDPTIQPVHRATIALHRRDIAPALGGLLLGRDTLIGHRRHRRRLVLDRRGRDHWSRSGGFCDRHRGRLLAFAAACCPCPADGAAASPSSPVAWTSRGA
ncbi:diiron oxygenase [Gordonia paraffinivorans]|uniref:diiron oxygenase n=1 Tax=Gordonia paraffinivorans TaxID=175628 RepID=UPI001E2BE09D|nr:diiron oxygenase [Gordonia paraffinivorans]MCD2144737.1 diiron oxygenase [Gordonia paraffinivorans]